MCEAIKQLLTQSVKIPNSGVVDESFESARVFGCFLGPRTAGLK
jgi:hypothetical protein